MAWIFSYAELGPQQIEELMGHAPFCALPASSPNFKVKFKGKSRKWGGAIASLDRCKGNWVYGSALLVSLNEVAKFDRYFQNQLKVEIPILIDATKDKVKAITYVSEKAEPLGQPSDDYIKVLLKHLKFFWGQGDNATLTLENFGILINNESLQKKESVQEVSEFKGKKKAKTQ